MLPKKWNLSVALSDDLFNSLDLLPDDCLLCGLGVRGLRVGKIVHGDGKEDVEEDVVAADEEDDEVDADDLAPTLVQVLWSLMGGGGKRPRSNESAPESFDVLPPRWRRTKKNKLALDVRWNRWNRWGGDAH